MKALIDGDIVVYRSAFAAEHTIYNMHDTHDSENPEEWTLLKTFRSSKEMKEYAKEEGITEYAVTREKEIEPVENVLYSIKHTIKSICKKVLVSGIHNCPYRFPL